MTELEERTLLRKLVGELNCTFYSIYVATTDFVLKYSFILDSGSSIHVSRTLNRFDNFRKAPSGHYAICGSGVVIIRGYGEVDIQLTNQKGRKRILRLHNVAYCPEFPTNLVSLQLLETRGIDWKHRGGELTFRGDSEVLGNTKRIHNQYVLEHNLDESMPLHTVLNTTLAIKRPQRFTRQSTRPRQPAWATSDIWHKRMGHLGPAALAKLGTQTIGVRLRGPSTSQCQDCAMAKITRQISRRPDPNKSTKPFHTVHIDWFDLAEGWDEYQPDGRLVRRCMIMTCEATGKAIGYFTTSAREDENLPTIKDAINWLDLRYHLKVCVVRSDDEMARNKTKA